MPSKGSGVRGELSDPEGAALQRSGLLVFGESSWTSPGDPEQEPKDLERGWAGSFAKGLRGPPPPTVISAVVSVDGRPVRLQLCDTAGQVSMVSFSQLGAGTACSGPPGASLRSQVTEAPLGAPLRGPAQGLGWRRWLRSHKTGIGQLGVGRAGDRGQEQRLSHRSF